MEMKFGFCQKKADGVKLYGLIARKVDIGKKVGKKNWECRVLLPRCCTYARWKAIPQKQHHLKKEKRKRLREEIVSRTLFGKGAARQ